MGGFMAHATTHDVTHQLNNRFRSGAPLNEMTEIQKEFGIFSREHSLRQTFRLLHIVPADFEERRGWFVFLDRLKRYPSDIKGVSGHDRIVQAHQQNLESKKPLPVFTTDHRAADDARVTVTRGKPIVFEDQEYLIISIPTKPITKPARTARAKRARR
jgi:hypothetical protein